MNFKTGVTGFTASLGWVLGRGERRPQHKSIKNVSIKNVRR